MALWENLTMPGLEALRQQTQTVILPLGSLEEHGPHLPLGTDTFHAMEVARRVTRIKPVVLVKSGVTSAGRPQEKASSSVRQYVSGQIESTAARCGPMRLSRSGNSARRYRP